MGAPKAKGAEDAEGGAGAALADGVPKLKGVGEDAGASAGFAGAPKENGVLAGAETGTRAPADGGIFGSSGAGKAGRLAKKELAEGTVAPSLGSDADEEPKSDGVEVLGAADVVVLPKEKGVLELPVPNRDGAGCFGSSFAGSASFCDGVCAVLPNKGGAALPPKENGAEGVVD